jgi:hypothetical protein
MDRPKAWPWAWQAGLGPVSPVAMGCNAAQVNSEVFFFFGLTQIQFNFEFGLNSNQILS